MLKPDVTSAWRAGLEDIEERMEARRDDLRDKGMVDGPQMESIIGHEKKAAAARLAKDLSGEVTPDTQDDRMLLQRLTEQ